jgi:PIN domain nuclease of toxin-antitoxin system
VTLLLDTQVALWWLTASRRLAKGTRELMAGSRCVISVASIWEVAIKHQIGKLSVPPGAFRDAMLEAGALILSITDEHALGTAALRVAHRDPFDRLLLSVAVAERLVLLTSDEALIEAAADDPRPSVRSV